METLGQFLKREREFRQVSVEELSRRTKINVRFLNSMENDRWEELPRGAFIRGFLKGYAADLGIPLEEVYRRYEAERPRLEKPEDPFRKFRGYEVKNQFFLFLVIAVLVIILAAYLSSR